MQLAALIFILGCAYSLALSFPRCVILARGSSLTSSHLDTLDDVLSITVPSTEQMPVLILNGGDKTKTMREALKEVKERDHELPEREYDDLVIPSIPVILFSGTNRKETMATIRALKSWDAPTSGKFPKCAYAVCVEPALDKTFEQLFDEIQRDFVDESKGIKHGAED